MLSSSVDCMEISWKKGYSIPLLIPVILTPIVFFVTCLVTETNTLAQKKNLFLSQTSKTKYLLKSNGKLMFPNYIHCFGCQKRNNNNNNNKQGSSIQLGDISTFCPYGYFCAWGISSFWLKNRQEKLLKFIKIMNHNKSSCIILVLNCFSSYILFLKRTETFRSRDVTDIRVLVNFEYQTHKDFMYQTVLNIFKFIFWDKCSWKIREKRLNYVKMSRYSQRFQVLND